MKNLIKKLKKGFTITELVIVIAVIAILAAVLIPTFANVINNANESAAMQEARSEWSNFSVEVATDASDSKDFVIVHKIGDAEETFFVVVNGEFQTEPVEDVFTYTAESGSGETLKLAAVAFTGTYTFGSDTFTRVDNIKATDSSKKQLYAYYDYEKESANVAGIFKLVEQTTQA